MLETNQTTGANGMPTLGTILAQSSTNENNNQSQSSKTNCKQKRMSVLTNFFQKKQGQKRWENKRKSTPKAISRETENNETENLVKIIELNDSSLEDEESSVESTPRVKDPPPNGVPVTKVVSNANQKKESTPNKKSK